ncbi:MAG: fibrobacter succinogenes major paralogous domain-containing protein [Alistipes sp.]|nr:fibrobacter succinogenes major paralogous domain-containing protein [Alistipes sp.]
MLVAPASGYRQRETGALTNVGAQGLCWSSSPFSGSERASSLVLGAAYIRPSYTDIRAYGFPVRCVQHLQVASAR